MVLDSADDLEVFFKKPTANATDNECTSPLKDYLPQNPNGSILLTTRDERLGQRLAGRHASMIVDRMSLQEAQDLLRNGQLELPKHSNLDDTRNLLEALEYLPLAISQAAAFISENHITLSEYLEILRTSDSDTQELLNEDLEDLRRDKESENSVIKTWKLSFDLISEREPRAAEILSLMAVLDRQGIPKSLLQDPSDQIVGFTKALGILLAFSLIKAGRDQGVYELHRMVQLATQNWLQMQHQMKTWQEKALSVVADKFPAKKFVQNRQICESLLPHAQTAIQYGEELGMCSEKYADLLCNVASFDGEYGRHEISVKRISAAYEVKKNLWGEEHRSTLLSMSHLVWAYRDMGRLQTAQELQIKFLQTSKRVLGPAHGYTINGMHLLGILYQDQRQWKEAEELLEQVIETYHQAQDPRALDAMSHLCIGYDEQGHYRKAIAHLERCVDLRSKISGADHRGTLEGMSILAGFHQKEGNYREAVDIMERLVDLQSKSHDLDHPWTLNCMENLSMAYSDVDRHSDAIALLKKTLNLYHQRYGMWNAKTLDCMSRLGRAFLLAGRYDDARETLEVVGHALSSHYGPSHPETLSGMGNLAQAYSDGNRHSDAIMLLQGVIGGFAKCFGAAHFDTLVCMSKLAQEYIATDRHSDAIPLLEEVLSLQPNPENLRPKELLKYFWDMARLGTAYSCTDRQDEAISLLETVLRCRTELLGAGHPTTMSAADELEHIRSMQRSDTRDSTA